MRAPQFHIRCDMEGVSGVVSMAQVTPHAPEYGSAREWFMAELLALTEGLLEGGAGEVSVYDEHWFGRNVDIGRMPRGVRVFCGKPPYRADWAGGLDGDCNGLILHGLHSMAESGHLLAHTYEPDFRRITLNGKIVGEIGLETAVAGDWGVPLVLVIADSAGAAEAEALVPGVKTVATKVSHAAFGGECLPLADTVPLIREAAQHVARELPTTDPYCAGKPVHLECSFYPGPYLEGLKKLAGDRFSVPDTLRLTGPTTTAVWADYWKLKLAVQAGLS